MQNNKKKTNVKKRRTAARLADDGGWGAPWSLVPGIGLPGGCASSRLDHGLKFYVIRGGIKAIFARSLNILNVSSTKNNKKLIV